ncbi:MAG: PadR family transcriptional regulator [Romboutsia sp.]|uniref:PadR family transcriptional regulator n=1 Tax=Clostridia TaxID=186801 RepID=UPI003EE5B607
MKNQIIKKIFNGMIYIHILHHASKEPIYGLWMMEELEEHGYHISPGTLYPILKGMVEEGLLLKEEKNVDGKIRKYYFATQEGKNLLKDLKEKLKELTENII